MTREEREMQLNKILQKKSGWRKIADIFRSTMGLEPGATLPGHLTQSLIIQEILEYEYPRQTW
jgi:hypothetical protein